MTRPAFRGLVLSALAAAAIFCSSSAFAVLPDEMLPDKTEEARALALSKNLRCVVCQNQNIDDSAAPIARDMRLLLRERIADGDTDQQAVSYLVQRYGNYVLLKPPFQADTWLLWLTPFGVLLIVGLSLIATLRRRSAMPPVEPLSASERARLAPLLGNEASASDFNSRNGSETR